MNNYLIKAYFDDYKIDLYRTFAINGRLTLDKLAYILISIFKAEPGYLYSFTCGNRRIVSHVDFAVCKALDSRYELDQDIPFAALNLKKGDVLTFSFGPSLSFVFHLDILDDDYQSDKPIENADIKEGKGYGIINELFTLIQYLNCKDDYLYMPSLGRKVERKNYFKFDFSAFDVSEYQKELGEELPILEEGYKKLKPRFLA